PPDRRPARAFCWQDASRHRASNRMTVSAEGVRGTRPGAGRLASRALGVLGVGLAGWMVAATVSIGAGSLRLVVSGLVVLWAATGLLLAVQQRGDPTLGTVVRSEEHTSELQS